MSLKLTIKAAVGAALLSVAAIPAFAQLQTIPTSGPTPLPGLVAGGLIVEVWDSAGNSLAAWLGPDSTTFGTPAATVAGTNLDYGILGGSSFNTLFGADAAGTVQFLVTAVNDVAPTTPTVDFTAQASTPLTTTRAAAFNAWAGNVNTAIGAVMNGSTACNNVNPCTATSPSAATSATTYLTSATNKIGNISIAGTAGGAALNFYQVVSTGGTAIQSPVQFASGTNVATWTLSATGDLVYAVPGVSAVPLPPAVWLLGSGLLGLAGIARRKALTA